MNKKDARALFISKLNQLSNEEKKLSSENACQFLSDRFLDFECVASFFPIHNEIDILCFNQQILNMGSLALPRLEGDKIVYYKMTNFKNELKQSPLNIPMPDPNYCLPVEAEEISVLILPGLAFDLEGYRLGYGKGYYDRFFSEHPAIKKVGVAYSVQVQKNAFSIEAHDQKVDEVFSF